MAAGADAARRVLVLRCLDWLDRDGRFAGPGDVGGGEAGSGQDGAAVRAFERVVAIVENFSPRVEVLQPGLCVIAVRGPARYFGGEAELAGGLTAAVGQAGFRCSAGIAAGLFAAGLAAEAGPTGLLVPPGETPEFLAGLPVSVLGLPELCDLLPRLGIETLGQLAQLPAGEAASRFGPAGQLAGRLARGLDPRPLVPRPPAADLSVQLDFDPPAEQSEPVIFAAKALAGELHDRLAAGGFACVRVLVQVQCADGRELRRLWRHDGVLSALAVAERVRWQLDGWCGGQASGGQASGGETGDGSGENGSGEDGSWPGTAGITLLRLVPDQLVRATGRQLALWGDSVPSDRVARAAVRVQAMLGHASVTRPVAAGGRRPADQMMLVPFGDVAEPRRPADRPWPAQIPAPAPATVFADPLAATVTDAAGQAVSVSGRAQLSAPPAWLAPGGSRTLAITAWAGPWPVTERWWDPERSRRQARFQLITDDGSAWLAVLQAGRWQLEGRYD